MTTTPGPRTKAGKRLLDRRVPIGEGHEADCPDCQGVIDEERGELTNLILAIEAEARADVDGLVARVAERHVEYMGGCEACNQTEGPWPCDAAKLVALLVGDKADTGTLTDCPIEGVHEHAFRGPHYFREWDPANHPSAGDKAEAPA